jgi:predicted transglutaminase-like cysteine proteinase
MSSANGQAQSRSPFLDLGQTTYTPAGWAEFCQRYKGHCEPTRNRAVEVASTDANVALIYNVNKQVNHAIKAMTDIEHWREIDRWDYAEDGSGDCEDYALVKRKHLLAAGLPQGALLMTVVRDENLDGHAVLTVRTDRGDLVLDNMTDQLHLWFRTPYRFVKIQSQQDPNTWVSIGAGTTRPQVSSR